MGPLQEAIDAVLIADARFTGRVFDAIPEGTDGWYVVIGDATEVPFDTHDQQGREMTLTLHVWSQARGFHEAQEVIGYLNELLDRQPLNVTGWGFVTMYMEMTETLRDGDWRHIPVRYRVLLQKGS